ncbi:matrix-associated zinc metalloprotease FibA [Myxococcus stipitatus DSM 14675]|uniref:Matrix-associated zinc metalloprotease FibA n=1 Tax=Myxococcus stipitatus (strain DSM 14675 / JCM 12634 / Mx s8) TaxID=1278073 RepID=L7UGA7_MYXSD|nr:M4 family metallopeptidase [Myxococcus stipitatus]AGC47996.1 matrix-associated zinc metalloprotease FibA [Myxococcus stipitatus DSM 14675]
MVNQRVRGALGVAALSFLVGCNESTPAPEANKPQEAAKKTAALGNGINIVDTEKGTDIPTFISGNLGELALAPAGAASMQQSDLAPALTAVAPLFHLKSGDLFLKKAYTDRQGDSHFRFGVRINDVDVYGGELRIHTRNGQIIAANTNTRSDLKAEAKPSVDASVAKSAVASDRESHDGLRVEEATELVYWRDGDQLILAHKVTQTGEKKDGTPVRDFVLVNAKNGDVMVRLPQIHEAINRRMHNGNNTTTLPGTLVRTEGQPEHADPVVNTNYDHLGTVYDCYNELFGRDSIDNLGGALISTVHHRVNYVNAFWNGTQMVYGDGDGVTASNLANSLDVTAHELTHAVTDYESELIYSGESGGMNESMSDIFGAVCEWFGDGKVVSTRTWLVGDDVWTPSIPNDALRYMANPTQDGDSIDYFPDYSSGIDVHYSSGIPNLAFYLLSQGGTHPRGKTTTVVAGIGIEKAAHIWYKANADILQANSGFEASKIATEQAATQLGYDAATIASVTNAWKAVGVGVPIIIESTEVVKNVPVTDIAGGRGERKYFHIEVPEGAYDLNFSISGGTGDADLHVRFGNPPTTTTYDCRPYRSGNVESCVFPTPSQGKWYAMLNGFSPYTGVTLTVTWKGGFIPVESGVAVKNLSGAAGSSTVFTLQVPERKPGTGTNSLFVQTGEGEGNPDVYVKLGSAPTKSDYDCRSVKEHMSEVCNLHNVPAGKYYIEVFGAKGGYEGIAFIASHK